MSKSSSIFKIYQPLTGRVINTIRKSAPKSIRKASDKDILQIMLNEMWREENVFGLPDFKVFCEEHYYGVRGKRAIFPESVEMIEKLLAAKYDCNSGALFTLPFDSFVLAIPKGASNLGYPIQSCLVTTGVYETFCDPHLESFCRYMGMEVPKITLAQDLPGVRQISIIYSDFDTPDLAVQTWFSSDQWPTMLSCKTAEEYHALYAKDGYTIADSAIQLTLFRLIAGIGIYNTATEGAFLDEGLPGVRSKIRMEGSQESLPLKHAILREGSAVARQDRSAPGYRTWHFRNLRDQRYYSGAYAHLDPGSRWVFVSDAIVNGRLEAYTLADTP